MLAPTANGVSCPCEPASGPTFEALPGRSTDLGGIPIRRLLPRSSRRLVGPWCFLDSFGPLRFASGKPMDVPPHPHIGLQTVSWLLDGEVLHHDSLGLRGLARPGVLNLMTAGRGIAHSEETPAENSGVLRGVQLWVALPEAHRHGHPAFHQEAALPAIELDGGRATVILGTLADRRSLAPVFSPIIGADLAVGAGQRLAVPLEPGFEHALVPLEGEVRFEDRDLASETLYYLGTGRRELVLAGGSPPARLLLLGGAPLGETILMWWNFVARTKDEIREARDDWEAGRRFGEVHAYVGGRLPAPPWVR